MLNTLEAYKACIGMEVRDCMGDTAGILTAVNPDHGIVWGTINDSYEIVLPNTVRVDDHVFIRKDNEINRWYISV